MWGAERPTHPYFSAISYDTAKTILFPVVNKMQLKPYFLIPLLLMTFLLVSVSPAQAAEGPQPRGGDSVCLPGAYLNTTSDCLLSGPAQVLTNLAASGITFPVAPFPIQNPDINLNYVPTYYAQVRERNAPVFSTLEDAVEGKYNNAARYIDAAFSYISYPQDTLVDGARFYEVGTNAWMTANDVIRVTPPRFQGYTFTSTPAQSFGWVLTYLSPSGFAETKRTPGDELDDYTGHQLKNHELVWVYETTQIGDIEWYLVGPDEWLPQGVIARVLPNTTPPEGVTGGRWIEVNLFEQTLAVYENYELIFATLIASGLDPFWTRPGLFQVYEKLDSTPMRGSFEADRSDAYYLEDVPWTMYFDQARALHGAYWRANLGFPQSHGCVNLSVGDSRWVFDWATIGDWVYVWDPSGRTPTDPELYSEGGA